MKQLLFGSAYYDEYMPCERLEQDVAMMIKAGINTVRIAESTWSTCSIFLPGVSKSWKKIGRLSYDKNGSFISNQSAGSHG